MEQGYAKISYSMKRGEIKIMEKDCCFTNENNWFRYRAAGIVVEGNEALFVSDDTIDYLYTVGGGVHMGESAEACVKREMFEETGVAYEIDHLAAVCENFFDGHGGMIDGMDCHCLEFMFLMKSSGIKEFTNKSINQDGNLEKLIWVPIDEISQYNIKPSFLKEKIREIIEGTSILHIVTEQDRKKKPDEILP